MSANRRAAVLDASVIVALYVEEPLSSGAAVAIGRLQHDHSLHAPELLLHEVSNAFAKTARRGVLTTEQCLEHLGALASSEIELHGAAEIVRAAMSLALAHNISAYDAAYLALTLKLDATLVTADAPFARRATGVGVALELVTPAG